MDNNQNQQAPPQQPPQQPQQVAPQTVGNPAPVSPPPPNGSSKRLFPLITVPRNQNPKKIWAFPLFGGLVKFIILIPQAFMLFLAGVVVGFFMLVNPFVVLFKGTFYSPLYEWVQRYVNLQMKVFLFSFGITDKYPGFSYLSPGDFSFKIDVPTAPSKLFAIPLFGFFVRYLLLLPFIVYSSIIGNSAAIMVYFSSVPVLFKKYYPESTHEFAVDALRLELAQSLYFAGISDTYPTFKISKNHLALKLLFIIPGTILAFVNLIFGSGSPSSSPRPTNDYNNIQYQNSLPQNP